MPPPFRSLLYAVELGIGSKRVVLFLEVLAMRWTYRILALAVLPFGILSIFEDLPNLWSGGEGFLDLTGVGSLIGFALILPGILNLLNDAYGEGAWGLRLTAVVVNGLVAALLIRLETLSLELEMFLLLPILFVALFVFSIHFMRANRAGLIEPSGEVPDA